MSSTQVFADLFVMAQSLFGMREEDLDADTGILELGLDSLMIIRFGQEIERRWGVSLDAAWFLSTAPSLNTLATRISAEALSIAVDSPQAGSHVQTQTQISSIGLITPQPANGEPKAAGTADAAVQLCAEQLQAMHKLFSAQLGALLQQPTPAADVPSAQLAPVMTPKPATVPVKPHVRGFVLQQFPLTSEQARFVADLAASHLARTQASKIKGRSSQVLADWKSTLSYRPELKDLSYPIVADRMTGGTFTDVDGNAYIDIAVGMGVHFLGHNPPYVEAAIRQRLERGFGLGPQCDLTAQAAQNISRLTGMERVTFCNTGSEAVMFAVRLARAKSRKKCIAIFSGAYHGIFDGVLAVEEGGQVHPSSAGTPSGMVEDVIILDYDKEASLARLDAEADRLAAVLVEPVQSRRPGLQPQTFLRRLRRLTREKGICLIFDEMVNGFRIAPGGSQEHFGIRADLALYGKVAGGGLPVGIIAGKKEYLDLIDGGYLGEDGVISTAETIVFGGTFCRHPLSMEAVVAVTEHLLKQGKELCAASTALTGELADSLNLWFQDEEVPLRLMHYGAQFIFDSYGPYSAFAQPIELQLFYLLLLQRGIYTWERRTCGLSVDHGPREIEKIAAAVRESVLAVRTGGFAFRLKSGAPVMFVPMTPTQERLFAIFQREHGQDAYHLPLAWKVEELKAWVSTHRERLGWVGLTGAIALLLLWPFVVVTIDSGHVGVLYRRFLGGTVMDRIYSEGTHLVWPWDTMHIFDARIHEELNTFSVLTKNGLLLEMDVSVLYHPIPLQTPILLRTVGKDYREKLVLPILRSSVRKVASEFYDADFYSEKSSLIQDNIHVRIEEDMGRNPVSIDNLLIRAVRLPETLNSAINDKMVAEQAALREAIRVREAEQRYKVRFIDAEAVRMTQSIVNENMSEGFLRWQGIEATKDIAKSSNAKFVITGGKDGLPIILNPDAFSGHAAPAVKSEQNSSGTAAIVTQESTLPGVTHKDSDNWVVQSRNYLERVSQENLDKLGRQLEDVLQQGK